MAARGSMPLRILIKTLLNIAVVWLMATYLDQYFQLTGGPAAFVIIGAQTSGTSIWVRAFRIAAAAEPEVDLARTRLSESRVTVQTNRSPVVVFTTV